MLALIDMRPPCPRVRAAAFHKSRGRSTSLLQCGVDSARIRGIGLKLREKSGMETVWNRYGTGRYGC